jgi:hypothetical protein
MERESFEKQEVADVLNADFVSIKGPLSHIFAPDLQWTEKNVQTSTKYT